MIYKGTYAAGLISKLLRNAAQGNLPVWPAVPVKEITLQSGRASPQLDHHWIAQSALAEG